MKSIRLLLLVTMLMQTATVTATSGFSNESLLAVYSHGFKVGEISSRYIRREESGQELLLYTSHTSINADFLVTSYTLEGDEEALIAPQGTRSYHKEWRENGEQHLVDASFEGGVFRCVSSGSASGRRTFAFPRESYDVTTMDCPELRITAEGEGMMVRLLDLEACEVVTRSYRWIRTERLTIKGVTELFRVVEFRDRNKSGTRWIAPQTVGVRIARQDGMSRKGAYSVRAIDPAK
jgi:hypothetical protein